MSDYIFERVDESRYKDLSFLVRESFGSVKGYDYFKHKMDTGYLGVKHLGYLAYDSAGKPAAFYGVYPCMVEYNGVHYLAAQSGDTMTHPKHGGKGLFTMLAKMTYELAKKEGVQFIFGFPNSNSYPGFVKKLNWIHKEDMTNYTSAVVTLPFAALAHKFTLVEFLYRYYVRGIMTFFKSNKSFLVNSALKNSIGSVLHDSNFFKYKSFNENFLIDLSGVTAWIKVDGCLLVGDIELTSLQHFEKLWSGLKRIAFITGCTKIIFPLNPGCAWDKLLKGNVKAEKGMYIGYLDLQSGLPLENFKYVGADYDTF
ncbi:MAG: GNAT family N-acetyltransferase [Chitinophagales bacterium]|nr:GNAT family N-acetyltransferase [Chitinophagales bacterium]